MEIPYAGDRLVVISILDPAERISAYVAYSVAPVGSHPKDLSVADASVFVFEDGVNIGKLSYVGERRYELRSATRPKAGKSYHLEASAPGYPDVYTEPVIVPARIPFDQYSFQDSSAAPFNSDYAAGTFRFSFTDPSDAGNFYRIAAISEREEETGYPNFWKIGELNTEDDVCGYLYGPGHFLTDFCFNGQVYEAEMGLETSVHNVDTRTIVKPDRIVITFQPITRSYYQYQRSIIQLSGLEHAFADPLPLISNVIGGYGVLGAVNTTVVTIEF